MSLRRIITLVDFGLFFMVLLAVALERQNILDEIYYLDYTPSAQIADLAAETTMTGYGKQLFYINHPQLESKGQFNLNCPNNGSDSTIVLGCYHPEDEGIFLYSVTDSKLNGVEQVTAAHEMLHVAYDHLSNSERSYVNGLLMNYYQHDLHNQVILNEIANYKKIEPTAWVNEMHSVFATQITSLPSALNAYYQQYFTDRQKIVDYANGYEQLFIADQSLVSQYDSQLSAIKTEITGDESSLNGDQQSITSLEGSLSQAINSADNSDDGLSIPTFNSEVESYNDLLTTTQQLVSQYNQIVANRNSIATAYNQLSGEINSNLTTISAK